MKKQKFLYPPPDLTPSEACQIWHKKMVAEYVLTRHDNLIVLRKWLRDAGVDEARMVDYGLPPLGGPQGDYHRLFDHGCVIKRLSDGALFVLGQPYNQICFMEINPHVKAWQDLGSEVTYSRDSGWNPPSTMTLNDWGAYA